MTTAQRVRGMTERSSRAPGTTATPRCSASSSLSRTATSTGMSRCGATSRSVSLVRRPCATRSTAAGSMSCRRAHVSQTSSIHRRESTKTPSRSKRTAWHRMVAIPESRVLWARLPYTTSGSAHMAAYGSMSVSRKERSNRRLVSSVSTGLTTGPEVTLAAGPQTASRSSARSQAFRRAPAHRGKRVGQDSLSRAPRPNREHVA